MTLKHFSGVFVFEMCIDYSFWNTETLRCIPKELNDYDDFRFYAFPPLCNRTEFDCLNAGIEYFRKYCPNKDENCQSYSQREHFFCDKSRTCIPKGTCISITSQT